MFGAQFFEDEVEAVVLDAVAGAGAEWARTRVQWSLAEPLDRFPPAFEWNYVDNAIVPLVARGFTPIVAVYSSPSWAASTACGPVNIVPTRFQFFMEQLAERYDGDGLRDAPGAPIVRHFQISNEPDFNPTQASGESDNGGCFGGNPIGFADHLRRGFLGLRAADPRTIVIFPGVAYDRFYNLAGYTPRGPFDYGFVSGVLDSLNSRYASTPGYPFYDWMAMHVYNDFRNAWDGVQPANQELIGKVDHFRSHQLVRPGVWDLRRKPLALTEASIPSMPSDAFTERSEALQSTYPAQLFSRGLAAGAGLLVWYSTEDRTSGSCARIYDWLTFGLLRSRPVFDAAQRCPLNPLPGYQVGSDHEVKPSREAYKVAAGFLKGATFDGRIGLSGLGSQFVEAYRFRRPSGRYVLVMWADNGERIGRIGSPPAFAQVRIDALVLPDWTGSVRVTSHLGQSSRVAAGTFLIRDVGPSPEFLEAD